MKTLIACSLWTVVVTGLAFDAPLPTRAWEGFELDPKGWSAAPTQAPSVDDLLRRQQNAQGLLIGPDGTCGYTSGSSAKPWGICCSTCSCAFGTFPGTYGDFYCCNSASCQTQTAYTCLDSTAISSRCTGTCLTDPSTLKCSVSPNTFCNLVQFQPVSVQALYCDSTKVLTTILLSTTYAGETGHSYVLNAASSSSSTSSTSSTSHAASSSPTTTATAATTTSSTSPTTTTTSASSSPPAPTQTSSSTPIGAIVGGAVGGVAVLALIGFLIFFFCRRRSRRDDAAPGAAPGSLPAQSYQQPVPVQQQPFQYQPQDAKLSPTPAYSPPPPTWSPQDQVSQASYQQYNASPQTQHPGGYSQPSPYAPSGTISPYPYHAGVDQRAVEAQGPNHQNIPTASEYSGTPQPPMAELGPRA